ncbi:ankyrin repeat domain-containing protein [Nitrincola lacisaponensis]|uniref:ankyrin repeat domain-containing protein n=1 Tax=Nitrincola lacisaponensis TaxID=267850 RepID=UPI00055B80A3|nr:ankyrin repeat domain-containing protein [Nitrincola lacisaponensis]
MIRLNWNILTLLFLFSYSLTIPIATSADQLNDEHYTKEHATLLQILNQEDQDALSDFLHSHQNAQWLQEEDTKASIINTLMYEAENCNDDVILSFTNNNITLSSRSVGSPYHFLGYMTSTDNIAECIDIFIRAGIDINATDGEGKTALIHILYSHHPDTLLILERLIDNGADPTLRSEAGLDLLHYSLLLHSLYSELIFDNEQKDDDTFINEVKRMVNLTKRVNVMFTKYYTSKSANIDINRI